MEWISRVGSIGRRTIISLDWRDIIVSPISSPKKPCFCQNFVNSGSLCFYKQQLKKCFGLNWKLQYFVSIFFNLLFQIYLKMGIVKRSYLFQLRWRHFFGVNIEIKHGGIFELSSLDSIPWENQQASCTELLLYYCMAVFCLLLQSRPCYLLTILDCSSTKPMGFLFTLPFTYEQDVPQGSGCFTANQNKLSHILQETILFC